MTKAQKTERNLIVYGAVKPTFTDRLKALPAILLNRKSAPTFTPAAFSIIGGGSLVQDATKINAIRQGWNKNATLYSIVRKIAKTCAIAPGQMYRVVNEPAYKRYKAIQQQQATNTSITEMGIAKSKALEPIDNHPLNDLFSQPNPQQSGSEYTEALVTYKLLTGDSYEWGRILSRGVVGELWPLPSHLMRITPTQTFPVGVAGYTLAEGQPIQFTPEEILHTKYFNPNYSFLGTHLYGFSPLQAAWLNLQQDNDARDAAIEMLQNRGVRGIVAMEGTDNDKIAAEAAGRLKARWREIQIEGKGGIVPMAGKVSFTGVGLSMADLKILEISGYTQDDLCNVYNVWSGLFNSQSNQKYDNVDQFRKDFILNAVIPELKSISDGRNRKLKTDWGYKDKGVVFDFDTTVYVELQKDRKALAEWLSTTYWFTPNEKRSYMDEGPLPDEAMNRVYIPSNLVPIDEVGMTDIPAQGGLNDYEN